MERPEKQAEIELLTANFQKAQVTVCADYRGCTVAQMTTLRRELRKVGSYCKVVKNTLARISAKNVHKDAKPDQIEKFLGTLEGPSLVVMSFEDPIAPTRVLVKFAKDVEKFQVKGCWLDGAYIDPAGVDSLSKMPGREETFAMLLSLMQAPATQLVRLLNEPGSLVARVVDAQAKKLEAAGA